MTLTVTQTYDLKKNGRGFDFTGTLQRYWRVQAKGGTSFFARSFDIADSEAALGTDGWVNVFVIIECGGDPDDGEARTDIQIYDTRTGAHVYGGVWLDEAHVRIQRAWKLTSTATSTVSE